jgi:formylglycine-generating enzyme required for sulfatase activity
MISIILLDQTGKPFVADFGLALKEENVGHGPDYAGTPAYMSPEQARGEGHRVDGRSDIFGLSVVFYELLVGRRPFRAESRAELLEQVTSLEVRPPRQYDDGIPKELDRICLKALSKRASERYSTAKDMADDLRHFLAEQTLTHPSPTATGLATPSITPVSQPSSTALASSRSGTSSSKTLTSDQQSIKIVPKGLRSFDAHDADFYLELLPGPRDREGLPDSIRFWKTRIEETDPEKTFTVGLICGPSGCGKSSLVKAGLLPRLSANVFAVYVEAMAVETEARLLNGLRKRCPALPTNLGLKETLAALRRGKGIPVGKKVLIVLDQFEQWLHANKPAENRDLVQALRQADGDRLQCILMVRDDFWMAVIRFMRELEIRLVEGQNSAAVDLFDMDHARKVLAAFGRAFGKIPENPSDMDKEQKVFLKLAVSGLAQEGKVISVRLALFAEMMKSKTWTPASWKAVGGTEGVGVTFLEETFSSATAPPEHRYHQKAARAVLKALLPESGTDIKGHMKSYAELLEASGYANRPKDFDDLLRILDTEIRLITPTDPEGKDTNSDSVVRAQPGQKYYQLTHDYLVHSLRDWLTHKQKETRRGRAELLLADRAAVWKARPENRQLPSLLQWLQIRWHTKKKNWTPPQRKMMGKAGQFHAVRAGVVAVLVAVATFTGLTIRDRVEEKQKASHAAGLVQAVLNADIAQVPAIVGQMTEYRQWTDHLLREENSKAADKSRQKLHTSLALLPVDASQVKYLKDRLLDAEAVEVAVLRDALFPYKDQLVGELWPVVESPGKGKESERLRAAAALAKYDAESEKWVKTQEAVDNDLVIVPAVYLASWMDLLRPVRTKLLPHLSVIYRNKSRRETERSLATDLLTDYAADNSQLLADLLMDADDKQFAIIYPKLKEQAEHALPVLTAEIDKKLPADLPSSDLNRDQLAKRQANAAVALLRLNQPAKVWPLLKHSPDPRVRSYLVHRFGPLGAEAAAIVKRLEEEPEITSQRVLILSLGPEEFAEQGWSPEGKKLLVQKLKEMYRTHPDPGLHAAAEWLLRQWHENDWLRQMNEEWTKGKVPAGAWRVQGKGKLTPHPTQHAPPANRHDAPPTNRHPSPGWYVNSQGQTMVVIAGPVEFLMGSPATEAGRNPPVELQHRKRIGQTFALAAKSVTLEQFRKFNPYYGIGEIERWARTPDSPIIGTDWYQAAEYCNWLSKQEGLPESQWCYEPVRDPKAMPALAAGSLALLAAGLGPLTATCALFPGRSEPEYKEGMKLARNYLQRTGYRLPTEAEIEYATRAGALTSRYFGETEDLLEKYAWYIRNSHDRTWPVGSKKPNDLGFFDIQGMVFTWCQEAFKNYPQTKANEITDDTEDALTIKSLDTRMVRGASFINPAEHVRSAFRHAYAPALRHYPVGFRPARTLQLDPVTALPLPAEGSRK